MKKNLISFYKFSCARSKQKFEYKKKEKNVEELL